MTTNEESILFEHLSEYHKNSLIPLHMPGHKQNGKFTCGEFPLWLDMTEVDGLDNLHHPTGILQQVMKSAAALWKSEYAYLLVNGSTAGVLSGIRTLTSRGDKILVAENCHKSVFHAIELCGLTPVFLPLYVEEKYGVCASVQPQEIETQLNKHGDIRLCVVTSPTYEGIISDIAEIARILHKKEIPLLVDEAHGAHLDLSPYFTGGAIAAGADIVVHSLHKTLPALTQTGILHVQGHIVNRKRLRHQLAVFQTSSPSYLLMTSIDKCIQLLKINAAELMKAWRSRLKLFNNELKENGPNVLFYGTDALNEHKNIFAFDYGKLVISLNNINLNASAFAGWLRKNYNIQLEMALNNYALAMTSICDSSENLLQLAKALNKIEVKEICGNSQKVVNRVAPSLTHMGKPTISAEQAMQAKNERVKLKNAAGKISAEYVWAYPPGVPILLPGQTVTTDFINTCMSFNENQSELHSTHGELPEYLYVVL